MYNEIPVAGRKYTPGDWKTIAVHDDKQIKGFFGDYRYLSNFYDAAVYYEGLKYPSSECAYQAAKLMPEYRSAFTIITPAQSKKLWKRYGEVALMDQSAEEWNDRKYDVMSSIVFDKFLRHGDLRNKLLGTGHKYLEERNWWKDADWGVDINLGGTNWLGIILMNVRTFWSNKPYHEIL